MIAQSVLALLGIGLALAVVLAIASRLLNVEEDPRIEPLVEALPGANCGGCGYAGCEAYAIAVLNNPDVAANLCSVGGAETAKRVGELTGKSVVAGEPTMSFRRCSRIEGNVQPRYNYIGANTCASAAQLEGGPYMCTWACLGFGDCLRACPFDAMQIRDNMVEIIASKCVSCGLCINACPRSNLQIIPVRARVMSFCATREKLKSVSEVCDVGCINCLQCLKACPADAITYEKRRIEINHDLCLGYGPDCGEACVGACPRSILRRRAPAQEHGRELEARPAATAQTAPAALGADPATQPAAETQTAPAAPTSSPASPEPSQPSGGAHA